MWTVPGPLRLHTRHFRHIRARVFPSTGMLCLDVR